MTKRREFIAGLGGSAVAWPLTARAQQPALPVIGYLTILATEGNQKSAVAAAFRRGLGEQGYAEGQNVEILERYALQSDRVPGLAADLVRRRAAVIAAIGTASPALAATVSIPIIFATGTDPVELGLVASLNRPGGNITGVTFRAVELIAKRLELLHEIVPAVKLIGFLDDPTPFPFSRSAKVELNNAQIAARALGVRLVIANATTPGEIEKALAIFLEQHVGAFVTANRALF
jgi:putative tryptophan/tyrosine transport system substrate-binding protein